MIDTVPARLPYLHCFRENRNRANERRSPKLRRLRVVAALALLAAPATAQQVAPAGPTAYQRAIAAGYKAAMYCAGIFNAGRTEAQIDRDELRGIYAEYDGLVPTLTAQVDRNAAVVSVAFDDKLPPRRSVWAKDKGCTTMPIGTVPPPVATSYATPPGPAAADPRPWPLGDAGIAPKPSKPLADAVGKAFDRATYGQDSETVGVVVVHDGRIVAERYRDGFGPFVSNRTWSVAKSIAGTLVGRAGNERVYAGAEMTRPAMPMDMIPPQWSRPGDPRRDIRIEHLLRMASGLHSDTAGNRTDAIYFGGTSVEEQALGWPLEAKPGTRFRYANNDILLAMLIVRYGLGEDRYKTYPHELFDALGMRHTVAETDWQGNFILSSQVWSTARDLARLGQFWLQDGVWQGTRLMPEEWLKTMTTPSGPQPASGPGYGATLWLFGPKQGLPEGSYAAQGNRGQYVMVVPSRQLVVVRRGEDPGAARFDIAKFAADVAAAVR